MGIRFPMCQRCGAGVLRIATPACGLVRNDRFFWECGGCRRGVGDAAPYASIAESAVHYRAAG